MGGQNKATITHKQKEWIKDQAREEGLITDHFGLYLHTKFYSFSRDGINWITELKFLIRMEGEDFDTIVNNQGYYERHRSGKYFDVLDPITKEIIPMKYFIQVTHTHSHGPDSKLPNTASILVEGSIHDARAKIRQWVGDYNKKGGQFVIMMDNREVYNSNKIT